MLGGTVGVGNMSSGSWIGRKDSRKSDGRGGKGGDDGKTYVELQGVRDGLLRQRMVELNDKGESLSLMCVGDNGLGKTTLLANLFQRNSSPSDEAMAGEVTKDIKVTVEDLEIDGFPFRIRMVDSPGWGESTDLERTFRLILQYLDDRMQQLHLTDLTSSRTKFQQEFAAGIDVLLYFIAPHRLKAVDVELLKLLNGKVTIIPILAKADSMTKSEVEIFRNKVVDRLDREGIEYFHKPFAIIGSETQPGKDGEPKSGRSYAWGFAESENEAYSDLPALRRCLVFDGLSGLHSEKLRLYEQYRENQFRLNRPRPLRNFVKFLVKTGVQFGLLALMVPFARAKYIEWQEGKSLDDEDGDAEIYDDSQQQRKKFIWPFP